MSGSERDSTVSGETERVAPVLRVVSPDATPEEIAAIVAVLASLGGGGAAPEPPRSEWASPTRTLRGPAPLSHGRGAWRASGLPR